jgi:hypothetical protein
MRTAQLDSKTPMAFSIDDTVAANLIQKATEYSKKSKKTASSFVSNLLKTAMENQDILNKIEGE